jgi:orotate phosphoribosyltransferase
MFEQKKYRQKAFNIIKERSFGRKKVILASGKESNFYFDLKMTMSVPEGANALAELILARLDSRKVDYVGGLAIGAVPLLGPIAILSLYKGRPLPTFFVRRDTKARGTMQKLEGVMPDELRGQDVVILDDVTTTGASAMVAVEEVRKAGANVILILSIVDRGEGAAEFFQEKGIPFEYFFTAQEFQVTG